MKILVKLKQHAKYLNEQLKKEFLLSRNITKSFVTVPEAVEINI